MLTPLPMKHVRLQILTDDLPQVALTLAGLELFSPDDRAHFAEHFPTIPGENYRQQYQLAASRLAKISRHVKLSGLAERDDLRLIDETELARLNDWLGKVWAKFSHHEETLHRLTEQEHLVNQLEQALHNFANLNIDLGLLQGNKRFLDLYIGLVPRENRQQLEEAVGLANHLLYPFLLKGNHAHVVIVGPRGRQDNELQSVLNTAGFQPLPIPPELRDQPQKIQQDLDQRRQTIRTRLAKEQEAIHGLAAVEQEELEQAKRSLAMAEPFAQLNASMRSSGLLSIVSGWIPACDISRTEQALATALKHPFLLTARDPYPEERALVPSVARPSRLLAPFSTLVRQYGIPRYGEVDPSLIFALTFSAMFGMMFGDIGHGAVIMLVAWLLRRRLKQFTLFVMFNGAAAIGFGILYGSLFGYEEILHPIWLSPLSDPIFMLGVALGWGIGFLLVMSFISVYNRMISADPVGVFFGANGVVSIVLYLALFGGTYSLYQTGSFGWPALATLMSSLLALSVYRWTRFDTPYGERALTVLVETFETVTGYVSNSLSFLRVAAFSLNHVALAIAVFTLADMTTGAGHWLIVILGNLFILILEGAIVTIQALRLEYYEGFSRFFAGDGREFRPLKLQRGLSA